MVVADLEQQGGQGLDISLWHFQGPWLLGTRRGPGGLVKIGGALGVTSLQRWGCGRDSGALWGGGCPLSPAPVFPSLLVLYYGERAVFLLPPLPLTAFSSLLRGRVVTFAGS